MELLVVFFYPSGIMETCDAVFELRNRLFLTTYRLAKLQRDLVPCILDDPRRNVQTQGILKKYSDKLSDSIASPYPSSGHFDDLSFGVSQQSRASEPQMQAEHTECVDWISSYEQQMNSTVIFDTISPDYL